MNSKKIKINKNYWEPTYEIIEMVDIINIANSISLNMDVVCFKNIKCCYVDEEQ